MPQYTVRLIVAKWAGYWLCFTILSFFLFLLPWMYWVDWVSAIISILVFILWAYSLTIFDALVNRETQVAVEPGRLQLTSTWAPLFFKPKTVSIYFADIAVYTEKEVLTGKNLWYGDVFVILKLVDGSRYKIDPLSSTHQNIGQPPLPLFKEALLAYNAEHDITTIFAPKKITAWHCVFTGFYYIFIFIRFLLMLLVALVLSYR